MDSDKVLAMLIRAMSDGQRQHHVDESEHGVDAFGGRRPVLRQRLHAWVAEGPRHVLDLRPHRRHIGLGIELDQHLTVDCLHGVRRPCRRREQVVPDERAVPVERGDCQTAR